MDRAIRAIPPAAGVIGVIGVAAGALLFAGEVAKEGGSWTTALALFIACSGAGCAAAAGLLVLSSLLSSLNRFHEALARLERYQYEVQTAAAMKSREEAVDRSQGDATLPFFDPSEGAASGTGGGGASGVGAAAWSEMVQLLREMRDNSLLSDEERREKRSRLEQAAFAQATEAVRAFTEEGDYVRTRHVMESLMRQFPDSPRVRLLSDQLNAHREQFESQDIRTVTRQVEDLMSISAWPRARQIVQQLLERHPDSQDARRLLLRLEGDHRVFQEEQRRRMYAEVQRFVTRKRWEEALAAAKTFVERFPGCSESEALLMQIPTLENNAQIETRQRYEAQIMDFAKHGRYIEAVELARTVIARFPDSPQAEALRSQLVRLEELANNPDAPPARVRIDS